MKRVLLLVVVPALLVALGFAQTPAASVNTDQTIKGCVGGSAGSYTVVEDGTGRIFKISAASVDFKQRFEQHLGHDVTLIGHKASGASSDAVDNSFVVTELNMISEHCAAVAAAPLAASAPSEAVPPSPAAPDTTTSTVLPTEIVPDVPAATTVTAPATAPAEITVTPAAATTPPAEIAVTPDTEAAAPVSTPWDKPVAAAADPTRSPASSRRRSATSAAVAVTPVVTPSTPPETARAPDAAAVTPAPASALKETASAPDAASITPPAPAPARHGALFLLIVLGVLVIVMGTLVPFLSRWRKRRMLEREGAENLSFTPEANSGQDQSDSQEPRKAA
jgi:hypothetical protein